MEEKILQACKLITNLGSSYTLKEWHETCIQILDLGLDYKSLYKYYSQNISGTTLTELEKGSFYSAANYICNFISWDPHTIAYVKEYESYLQKFIHVVTLNT